MDLMIPISSDLIPPDKLDSLNRLVLRQAGLLQTHVVSQHLGQSREKALSVLQLIASRIGVEKVYLIYHEFCLHANEAFVEERLVRDGLPSFPYICPLCKCVITDERQISYDFAVPIPAEMQIIICSYSETLSI